MPPDPGATRPAAARLVAALAATRSTIAVAESLTGGAVTAALVDIPGSSAVLRGGVVAYATDLKTALLHVAADLLAERGPVDPEVARAMAHGARERLGADWGLATTGVAGPDPHGGCEPGTFHVAVVGPGVSEVLSVAAAPGTAPPRAQVRAAAALAVLLLAHRLVGGNIPGPSGVPTS